MLMSYQDLSDREIAELIVETLEENGRINLEFVEVECVKGRPHLLGRVSSDAEIQLIDEIIGDVLDIHDYENSVWVDDTLAFEKTDDEDKDLDADDDDADDDNLHDDNLGDDDADEE